MTPGHQGLELNAPPSSYAIADALQGQPGAWPRVIGLTAFRAVPLSLGLLAVGVRGRALVTNALAGSIGITLFMLGYYALRSEPALISTSSNLSS